MTQRGEPTEPVPGEPDLSVADRERLTKELYGKPVTAFNSSTGLIYGFAKGAVTNGYENEGILVEVDGMKGHCIVIPNEGLKSLSPLRPGEFGDWDELTVVLREFMDRISAYEGGWLRVNADGYFSRLILLAAQNVNRPQAPTIWDDIQRSLQLADHMVRYGLGSPRNGQDAGEALRLAEQQLLRLFEIAVMQHDMARMIQPGDTLRQQIAEYRFFDFVARRAPDSFGQREYLPREQDPRHP